MIPQADLDAMRARAEAATPGPWEMHMDGAAEGRVTVPHDDHNGEIAITLRRYGVQPHAIEERNAAFIAAARTDVPRLLDAYEELLALARELAEALEQIRDGVTLGKHWAIFARDALKADMLAMTGGCMSDSREPT